MAQLPVRNIDDDLVRRLKLRALPLRHPVYDCFYLLAAHIHDTHLVAADQRFVRRVAALPEQALRVRLLADPIA